LVTTNAVIIETHALLLSRSRDGHANAIKFLDMIASDAYRVERIRKADEEKAIVLVRTHQDKDYSLCDALSFTVMERLRIREAIAFDRHSRPYGRFLIL
jgi:predicted nucleic acid-binding protein